MPRFHYGCNIFAWVGEHNTCQVVFLSVYALGLEAWCTIPWQMSKMRRKKKKKVNVSLRRSCFAKRTKLQMLFQHKNIHIHTHPSEGELKTFLQQCKSKILKSYAAATKWIRAFWSFNYYTLWSKVSVGSGMSSTRNKIETHKNFFDSSTRELDANQAHQVLQSFRTGAAI